MIIQNYAAAQCRLAFCQYKRQHNEQ